MTQTNYNKCIANLTSWINEQIEFGDPEEIFEAYEAREEFITKNKVREFGYGTNGEYWEEQMEESCEVCGLEVTENNAMDYGIEEVVCNECLEHTEEWI